jgi:hypothetical protein
MLPYDSAGLNPPGPRVVLRVTDLRRGTTFPAFSALVDSGADWSGIEAGVLETFGDEAYDYDLVRAQGMDGKLTSCRVLRVLKAHVEVLDADGTVVCSKEVSNLGLLILPEGHVGRDILNAHRCILDGPNLTLSLS